MWSPTKLDFLFYDFSMIYYDFFKDSVEIIKKEIDKPYRSKTTIHHSKIVFKTAQKR